MARLAGLRSHTPMSHTASTPGTHTASHASRGTSASETSRPARSLSSFSHGHVLISWMTGLPGQLTGGAALPRPAPPPPRPRPRGPCGRRGGGWGGAVPPRGGGGGGGGNFPEEPLRHRVV